MAIGAISAILSVCVMVFGALSLSSQATNMRNSADLAAISAAQILADTGDPVQACSWVSEHMSEYEAACEIEGENVHVSARLDSPLAWLPGLLKADAVAGPEP
ncbi:hypothetical protein J2S49_001169 [Arcanobacterium wilhelmae]|uniref:Helicase/secretion neighborhood TadE-like protein n=1 Tax=Arcanobacterium wilhelmae TaxID=1803177 RepID=A0ABT9NC68_9ACTO|nr:hypothetical protein [Arcanobacterium wilhelmae]MDP9801093.1 hypothetical protein [Arcanobacterium wilhelmae]WFN90448.1 hypothetical protein P8A24_00875 [Arcanobacterium wilhelmae]